MKYEAAKKFITRELKDLDVHEKSVAWKLIYENAVAASDVLTKAELKKLIADSIDLYPLALFEG